MIDTSHIMINEQLLQYITKQRDAGTADEKIKENLRAAGWKDEDIQEGFDAVAGDSNSPQSHQQMRKQAAQQNNDTTTDTETDQTQASQNKTQPNATQQDAKPDTSDGNAAQSEKDQSVAESKQPNTESDDQYREPVAEEDTQNATANDPSRTANEDPTPLRTMEEDQKRAQGGGATTKNESSSQQKKVEMSDPSRANKTASKPEQASPTSGKSTGDRKQEMRTPNDQRVAKQKTQGKKSEPQKPSGHKQDRKPKSAVGPGSGSPDANQQSRQQRGKKGAVAKTGKSAGPKQAKQQPRQRSSQIQKARQQSSSSSVATIILSILGLIVIGGGAAYAYVTYFQGPIASTNAQSVIQALADSESFQYRIGISKQSESSSENTLIIEGAVDTDPDTSAQTYYTIQGPQSDNSSPVTGLASEFAQYSQLDQRQQQTIQQALTNQQFLSVGEFQTTQTLGATEDSSGFSTQRFGVSLDPGQLFDTYATIHQAVQGGPVDPDVANTLRDNLSGFRPQQGQLWVHPTSSVPYQLTVIGDTQNGETLQVNMQFKNHGQEITGVNDTYQIRSIAAGLSEYYGGSASTTTQSSIGNDNDGTAGGRTVTRTGSLGSFDYNAEITEINDTTWRYDVKGSVPNPGFSITAEPNGAALFIYWEREREVDQENETEVTASGTMDVAAETELSEATFTVYGRRTSDDGSQANNQNNTQSEREMMRRQDQIRINDAQQIAIAAQVFANENGRYPASTDDLVSTSVLSEMPQDPGDGIGYLYTANENRTRFHVGITLKATNESALPGNDANLNSSEIDAMVSGFNGAGEVCNSLREDYSGSTCYDITRQIGN